MRQHNTVITIIIFAVLVASVFLINKFIVPFLPEELIDPLGIVAATVGAAAILSLLNDLLGINAWLKEKLPASNLSKFADSLSADRKVARDKRTREIMLKKVEIFWVKGLLENSLHGAVLLQLGMEYKPEMVEHLWDMVLQRPKMTDQILPEGTSIVQVYDSLGESLLILGEPGSGKTTALLELTRDLIERAREKDDHPIPVVFNLSSWAENRKPIGSWLVDELNSKYHVPIEVGEAWVTGDELLLLLDGLDEVRDIHRNTCVYLLNEFRRKHMVNVVVCSRTADYEALTNKLALAGAILQKPLTVDQIETYLKSFGEELSAVQVAVRADIALQQLARSPLVLSIIAMAYQGMSLNDLKPGTLEERRKHLFSTYVKRMFEHRKVVGGYKPRHTVNRLSWLSREMIRNSQTVFHIEQLQPQALSNKILWGYYVWCFGIIMWLLVGISVGVATGTAINIVIGSSAYAMITGMLFGFTSSLGLWIAMTGSYQLSYRIALGIITGLAILFTVWIFTQWYIISFFLGLSVGIGTILAFARIGGSAPNPSPEDSVLKIITSRQRLSWSWRTGIIGFVKRLPLGILFGLAGGITGWAVFGWVFGLAVWVSFGLTMAVAGSISYGMISLNIEPLSKPNEGIWRSLENAIRFGIISGLWCGLNLGFLAWILSDLPNALIVGASFTVAGFFIAGIVAGGFPVLQHAVLRVFLFFSEDVPIRYPAFLNHAKNHIFLRKVGSGFIFIHRLLLEYFAELEGELSWLE